MSFSTHTSTSVQLLDYGTLQARYMEMDLIRRAQAVYEDAQVAIDMANELIDTIAEHPKANDALAKLRSNTLLLSRLRNSEAKSVLMDSKADYFKTCKQKLAAWHLSISRIIQKESVIEKNGELIVPVDSALGMTLMNQRGISAYLSILPLVLGELSHLDDSHANEYAKATAQIRRCGTLLSDCETASDLTGCVKVS